ERIAEEILKRANSGEVLAEVAKIYDTTVEKINVGKSSNVKEEMINFCLTLKDDECKMTKIGDSYYVVYCYLADDELVTQSAKEVLEEEKRASHITEFVKELEKDTPVTINKKAWETINFEKAIFTKSNILQSK
ncbi:MAG: hypothetical protein IJX12_01865, partial [Lachnospiraceae bacterium]|nr:hypothetical protein [Lachnospiraceae bacterium]